MAFLGFLKNLVLDLSSLSRVDGNEKSLIKKTSQEREVWTKILPKNLSPIVNYIE
jgi:hypothetical protein